MKVNKIFVGLFMTLSLLSCKNEDKKDGGAETTTEQSEVNKNSFTVILNAVVNKDDSFQVYYKAVDDDKVPFEEKNSMYVDVKGSDKPQDITFSFPEDASPNQIRLDYGTNKEQTAIKINRLTINYLGKSIDLNGKEFFKHFIFNENTLKKDTINQTITPIATDGGYDPMSYSEKLLNDKLIGLMK